MRIRSMSAGRSGASVYNANVNGDQGGGDAKQGLAPTTNKRVQFVLRAIQRRAYASSEQRSKVFCINQLGGIGRPSKMFATTADGVNKAACLAMQKSSASNVNATGFLNDLYMLLLGRGVDKAGFQKYSEWLKGNYPAQMANLPVNTNDAIIFLKATGIPDGEIPLVFIFLALGESPEFKNSSFTVTDAAFNAFMKKYFSQVSITFLSEAN